MSEWHLFPYTWPLKHKPCINKVGFALTFNGRHGLVSHKPLENEAQSYKLSEFLPVSDVSFPFNVQRQKRQLGTCRFNQSELQAIARTRLANLEVSRAKQ